VTDDAFALFEADDSEELNKVDEALERTSSATTKESALAALATATAGLNAYASRQIVAVADKAAVPPAAGEKAAAAHTYYMYLRPPLGFGPRPGRAPADRQSNLETRLEKFWTAAQGVVDRFRPTQYQISLGFPVVVSVTFTWDVPRVNAGGGATSAS